MDDDAMASGHDHDHDHDPFCSGDGTVMLNGFQVSLIGSSASARIPSHAMHCVLLTLVL